MIVLCDLDGTLIDKNYRLTIESQKAAQSIDEFQNRGHFVGIISDTPRVTLENWSRKLAMKGPICAECGAEIVWPTRKYRKILIPDVMPVVRKIREKVIGQLLKEFPGCGIIIGDINHLALNPNLARLPNRPLILINGLRRYSFSLFVRGEKSQEDQTSVFRRVVKIIQEAADSLSSLGRWDYTADERFYFVSLLPKTLEGKKSAIRMLRSSFSDKIVVIGDSYRDYIADKGVLQVAVENAEEAYKGVCDLVCTQPYTQGVIEALQILGKR